MANRHKSHIQKEIKVGNKVYVKLTGSSPERAFTVTRIIDKVWIEVEHFDGTTYVIDRNKAHSSPSEKKIPVLQGNKSIPAISTPMGGQPSKRKRGRDTIDEIRQEQRLLRKKKVHSKS